MISAMLFHFDALKRLKEARKYYLCKDSQLKLLLSIEISH